MVCVVVACVCYIGMDIVKSNGGVDLMKEQKKITSVIISAHHVNIRVIK